MAGSFPVSAQFGHNKCFAERAVTAAMKVMSDLRHTLRPEYVHDKGDIC